MFVIPPLESYVEYTGTPYDLQSVTSLHHEPLSS